MKMKYSYDKIIYYVIANKYKIFSKEEDEKKMHRYR